MHLMAQFDADAAQHQQPENHHEWQIESAEAGGIEERKSEVERSASGEQPDFVSVPHRADGTHDGLALPGSAGGAEIDDSGAKIESVEHDISGNHDCDNHEPKRFHISPL